MTAAPPVTMRDLKLEHAGLLPGRETLPGDGGFAQGGYGNTAHAGLLNVVVANGSFNNILSSGNIYA